MDSAQESRYSTEDTESMWKTLAATFTDFVNVHGSHLEKILNMIRTDITFDDPGLFPRILLVTNTERNICRKRNFWLMYQLLRIASVEDYRSISTSYISLQKEIITACFIKQRWLALEILTEFINLLDRLNSFRQGESVTIHTFSESCVNDDVQGEEYVFEEIVISSVVRCHMLRVYCLHALSEAVSIVANDQDEESFKLVHGSICMVLQTLSCGNMPEKRASVLFFRNYFKHNSHALSCRYSLQTTVDMMSLLAASLNRLNTSSSPSHINEYLMAITELLNVFNTLQTWSSIDREYQYKLNTVVVKLLTATNMLTQQSEESNELPVEKVNQQLIIFLQKMYPSPIDASRSFISMDRCSDVLLQLDDTIVNQIVMDMERALSSMVTRKESRSICVKKVSDVWDLLIAKVEQNHTLLGRTLALANNVNFNHRVKQKGTKNEDLNAVECKCLFFESSIPLFDMVNGMIKHNEKQMDLLNICMNVIHIEDFSQLSVDQQQSLLVPLFAPFRKNVQSDAKQQPWNIDMDNEVCHQALALLCNMRSDYIDDGVAKSYLTEPLTSLITFIATSRKSAGMKRTLMRQFKQLILSSKISLKTLIENVLLSLMSFIKDDTSSFEHIVANLNLLCCIQNAKKCSLRVYQDQVDHRSVECDECVHLKESHDTGYYDESATIQLISQSEQITVDMESLLQTILSRIKETKDEKVWKVYANFVLSAMKHGTLCVMDLQLAPSWLCLFGGHSAEVCKFVCEHGIAILKSLSNMLTEDPDLYDKYIQLLITELLSAVKLCNAGTISYSHQSAIIRMIVEFADATCRVGLPTSSNGSKEILMHCVRMMLFLLMDPESLVTHEASIAIAEMCARQNVTAWNMLCWYRHDLIMLMIGIAVSNYTSFGITLHQSLTIVSHTFECRDPVEFVSKHYKIMVAILLPWCLRIPKCDDLLREVALIVRKDLVVVLSISFLNIYTYLFISKTVEVTNQCIEYIMKHTGNSFFHLLHSDIKRTVFEVLMFYHINAECVIHAIRSLLSKDCDIDLVSTARIAEYIAERFLGVLANFEATLVNPDGEKALKRHALLSLGDIFRLLGGEHITPFRFKILAVLRTVLASEEEALIKHCVNVWRIFVCTVDVRQLGSLLSTIFVTLEPLLASYPEDVGYIFKYLVMENNNLLGNSLGDLFFLEDTNVADDIKKIVASRIPMNDHSDESSRLVQRLEELMRHCNHENLKIRTFALSHLSRLFESHRAELNEAILGQHQRIITSTISTLVETLIRGLCEHDTNLQKCAAKCLGELGAIAPGHLPPNYAPAGLGFALSIHSDAFAIIALRELCRAYQRQKDSKFVDSFSLAIQEILNERGVVPSANKKRDVWETIPERLRPIMEPLLTSCYTTVSKSSVTVHHPVFKNVCSSHEWSYQWASQMIESITRESTRNLLRAFKPSLRCDRGTLMMMLPYILLHSLQLSEGINQKNRVVEELQIVFNAAIAPHCNGMTVPVNDTAVHEVPNLSLNDSTEWATQGEHDASSTELALQCSKYAFGLFDFLERWKRQRLKEDTTRDEKVPAFQQDLEVVEAFLNNFDSEMLAKVNFKCHEYARALQYLEKSSIEEDGGKKLQGNLSFLSEIYSRLGDTDSVEGVMSLKATEPTLPEQILYHNATGRLHEAVACYERLLQLTRIEEKPPQLKDVNSMIECYLRLDQPETALLLAESLLARFHDTALHGPLLDIQAEPLYRLGRFEDLKELLHQRERDVEEGSLENEDRHWGVICGSLIIEYRQPLYERFTLEIERARLCVVRGGCTGRISSRLLDEQLVTYEKRYEQVLKLHIISEFEKCGSIMQSLRSMQISENVSGITTEQIINKMQEIVKNLDAKLELLQPNATTLEPIISLRRILLKEIGRTVDEINVREGHDRGTVGQLRQLVDQMIGELWMKSAELASRTNTLHQQTLPYILHAESYRPRDLFIKNAQLLWYRRDVNGALKVLERGVNEILGDTAAGSVNAVDLKSLSKEQRLTYAEGKRLIAAYNAEASNISASLNRRYFKEAIDLNPESEIALVQLAQYVDKLYNAFPASEQDSVNCWEMMFEVMKSYGKSMMYGSTYLYQSMPRVLSIWLDSSAKALLMPTDASSSSVNMSRKIAQSMNKLANKFKDTLSPYFFFTAFSQLISRVAHPSSDTYHVLKGIIVKLLLNYPQQTLWMMLSVYKSSYTNRVRRCVEIFNDRQLEKMQKLIKDFNELAERLIELTNKEIPGVSGSSRGASTSKITVSSLVKALPKMLAEKNFSNVLIPIERCMQLVLNKSSGLSFQPYPTNAIYMVGIDEEVTVLHSLQKPRKITLRGHNGRSYTMMMKPKDDLRKDFRLMEFNAVVKQYLYQDADAKFRRLYIRTYAVLPLNEECGIIEWISNLNTFRGIVCTYYKQRGLGMTAKELRNYNYARTESLAKKRHAFDTILLPRHPPVFSEWFRDCFPNPHNWFQARSSYIKTTAVISMVGYILGLGDRHGENILFDSSNGDTVHVDFNCLFNRGETFQIPELVPFRLTHNMVDAMGPLGVEGLYRRCCEIVLRILQTHAPTFMSVLKPFVYDPMVSWSKVNSAAYGDQKSRDNITERTDPQAMHNVLNIEERLKGYVKINGKLSHMPLSIEGQVNHLIKEATDKDNLAQMYIGWSGYT